MATVYQMGNPPEDSPAGMTNIDKMQLAVQIAAIVQASFKRPSESDVRELLSMAASQLAPPDARP